MNEDGVVSLWVGMASKEAFDASLKVSFSEDGDFLGSKWSRAFGIRYYDEGVKEAVRRDSPTRRLDELLRGVSYEDVVIPRFESIAKLEDEVNCCVLLYNCRHHGRAEWTSDDLVLRFVGTVSYR
jgi:hypothetical protein